MFVSISSAVIVCLLVSLVVLLASSKAKTRSKSIRGPPRQSWFLGNERDIRFQRRAAECESRWSKEYGTVVSIGSYFGQDTLLVSDPKALQYMFHTAGYRFPKGGDNDRFAHALLGPGVITVGGSDHQRQRRILNPAFTAGQIHTFLGIFQTSGEKLVNHIKSEIGDAPVGTVNVVEWAVSTALDVLGLSLFRHDFGALDGQEQTMSNTIRLATAQATQNPSPVTFMLSFLSRILPTGNPWLLSRLPTAENNSLGRSRILCQKAATSILARAKEGYGKGRKDVVGLLLATDGSTDSAKRMTLEEILSQMASFIVAGQDTTSTTLSFILHQLSKHPAEQERLRQEIQDALAEKGEENLEVADYEALPYLNAVIKETLRFHPVVHTAIRKAGQDDVLPLAEPITLADGTTTNAVPVQKNQNILVSLHVYNYLPSVWGSDADEWNPDRFLVERASRTNVGVYANLMSFGAGVRACIGWRFAIVQLQVLTVLMVKNFEFKPAANVDIIVAGALFGAFPAVESKYEQGPLLPLELRKLE